VHGLKAILFDLGGTLDGPGQPWVDRFAVVYRDAGIVVPMERLRAAAGQGTRDAYRCPEIAGYDLRATVAVHVAGQFAHLGIDDARAARGIVDAFVDGTTAALAESRAVLARLAPRFALGVVSNFYGNAARVLADAGIGPLLAVVVDSAVCGLSKPDPAIFALALERLGVGPREALFVGDSLPQDVVPARAAGLRTAWLVGAGDAPASPPADVCLRTLDELERLLLS
jgi:putative hydrolase of the HAD superfamily